MCIRDSVQIEQQIANAGAEVVHVEPDQAEQDDLGQGMSDDPFGDGECFRRREAALEQP